MFLASLSALVNEGCSRKHVGFWLNIEATASGAQDWSTKPAPLRILSVPSGTGTQPVVHDRRVVLGAWIPRPGSPTPLSTVFLVYQLRSPELQLTAQHLAARALGGQERR